MLSSQFILNVVTSNHGFNLFNFFLGSWVLYFFKILTIFLIIPFIIFTLAEVFTATKTFFNRLPRNPKNDKFILDFIGTAGVWNYKYSIGRNHFKSVLELFPYFSTHSEYNFYIFKEEAGSAPLMAKGEVLKGRSLPSHLDLAGWHGGYNCATLREIKERFVDKQRLCNAVFVPINTDITVFSFSKDIPYKWAIPALNINIAAEPSWMTESTIRIENPGLYYEEKWILFGGERICMPIRLYAVSPEDFEKIVKYAILPEPLADYWIFLISAIGAFCIVGPAAYYFLDWHAAVAGGAYGALIAALTTVYPAFQAAFEIAASDAAVEEAVKVAIKAAESASEIK